MSSSELFVRGQIEICLVRSRFDLVDHLARRVVAVGNLVWRLGRSVLIGTVLTIVDGAGNLHPMRAPDRSVAAADQTQTIFSPVIGPAGRANSGIHFTIPERLEDDHGVRQRLTVQLDRTRHRCDLGVTAAQD